MIGVFDSGLGGISVFREIYRLMPGERYVYVADSAYCPYGPRPAEEIRERACAITDFLVGKGCGIVVVACNTATAGAISFLRDRYDIPFVGMEPAVKLAAVTTSSRVIGVLATRGTLRGELYHNTLARFASGVKVIEKAADGLVEMVENDMADSGEARALLDSYVGPMVEAGADRLVLGCTHYPFLVPLLKSLYGDRIEPVDPAPAVALRCRDLVMKHSLSESGDVSSRFPSSCRASFFTTGDNQLLLERMVRRHVPGIEVCCPEFLPLRSL